MKAKKYPNQEELKQIFYYDGENLRWLVRKRGRKKDLTPGCINKVDGYRQVRINGKTYRYHRLLWIFINGEISEWLEIDHINHSKTDNRIENLRLVSHAQNRRNSSMRKNSICGIPGVSWDKGCKKFRAKICIDGKRIYLGCFDNKADAYVRYKAALRKYGFHDNHGKIL